MNESNIILKWIESFNLFLFDFDGLLVNTEQIHFAAYQRMCLRRGFKLEWDYPKYCLAAHYESTGLRDHIYAEFPELFEMEPVWAVLYAEKKQAYMDLLNEGAVHLMPGVEEFLAILKKANVNMCVVTHSPAEQIKMIRRSNPQLDSIPVWITREYYTNPKPNPEPYLKALEYFGLPGETVIGFEDSPRGLKSLLGTSVQPILVCAKDYPGLEELKTGRVLHFDSFHSLVQDLHQK
jgi:HAD superfamily hydrolase (TIGR01509 family)